jgi:hypothetical protein
MTQVTKTNKGLGGPKTAAGKKISSSNARKASIFTQGYLPDEDVSGKQERLQAMVDQWQAHDPSRQLLLLTVEQAELGIERMMKAERMKIEGIMASVNISREFCIRAGIADVHPDQIPLWYFNDDASSKRQKALALQMPLAWDQGEELKAKYSDALVAQVPTLYPELLAYVARTFKSGHSFSTMLSARYKQTTPELNLAMLMNEITGHKDHLRWAGDSERYQAIIDGLKAEKVLAALDLEKSSRYATTFQNRILKAFAGLAAMDQHEAQITQTLSTIEMYQSTGESSERSDQPEDVISKKANQGSSS